MDDIDKKHTEKTEKGKKRMLRKYVVEVERVKILSKKENRKTPGFDIILGGFKL
jgi:hypothetical protein